MAKNSQVESAGLNAIPIEERKSWPGVAFIWAGSCCCVPALMVGAGITMGLPFGLAALAMIIGYSVSVIMMILMSILSADRGLPGCRCNLQFFWKSGCKQIGFSDHSILLHLLVWISSSCLR